MGEMLTQRLRLMSTMLLVTLHLLLRSISMTPLAMRPLMLSLTFMMPLARLTPLLSLMFTLSPSLPCHLSHADMPVLPFLPQPSLPQQSDMLLPQPLPPQLSQLPLPLQEDTVMPAATAGLVPRALELLPLALGFTLTVLSPLMMSLLLLPLRLTTLLLVEAVPWAQLLTLLPQPLLPTNGKHGHYKQVSKNAPFKGTTHRIK